ncbi:MAG: hypothetical protein AAGB33_00080 [Cellulomonas sp.]|nr:hypothetical protein [Rickettsiella sp.]
MPKSTLSTPKELLDIRNPRQASYRSKKYPSSFIQTLNMTMDVLIHPIVKSNHATNYFRAATSNSKNAFFSEYASTRSCHSSTKLNNEFSTFAQIDPMQTEIEEFEAENFELYLQTVCEELKTYLCINEKDWEAKKKSDYKDSIIEKFTTKCKKQESLAKSSIKKTMHEKSALISLGVSSSVTLTSMAVALNVPAGILTAIGAALVFFGSLGLKLNKVRSNKQIAKNLLPYLSGDINNNATIELVSLLLTLQLTDTGKDKKKLKSISSIVNSSTIKPFKKECKIRNLKDPIAALEKKLEDISDLAKKNTEQLFNNLNRYVTKTKYSSIPRRIHDILIPKPIYANQNTENLRKCNVLMAFLGALAMSIDKESTEKQAFFYEKLIAIRKKTDEKINTITLNNDISETNSIITDSGISTNIQCKYDAPNLNSISGQTWKQSNSVDNNSQTCLSDADSGCSFSSSRFFKPTRVTTVKITYTPKSHVLPPAIPLQASPLI